MEGFQLPSWNPNQFSNTSFSPNGAMPVTGSPSGANAGMGYQPLEFGMNMPTVQLGLQGLGTLGSLWGSFQSNKLARDSMNFQKDFAQKNLANSIKSYNTALTDRATSRGFVQGDSKDTTQQYINDNKL